MWSSECGHLDITRFLVESKADVAAKEWYYTPKARAIAVSKLTRCVAGMAKLPSDSPSIATRATLQRICAALERRTRSDDAAAHRAHQSQTAPSKRFFPSRRINAVASSSCSACRTRRNKIALECFSSNAKNPIIFTPHFTRRAHINRTSHVLFYSHITRHDRNCFRNS